MDKNNPNTNYTSIVQVRRLVKLGLDPNTADMRYVYDSSIAYYDPIPQISGHQLEEPLTIPCWSLGRLLEIMPKYMKSGNDYFELMVIPFYPAVKYYNEDTKTYMEMRGGTDIMEAAVNMAERLLICKSTYLKDNPNKMLGELK